MNPMFDCLQNVCPTTSLSIEGKVSKMSNSINSSRPRGYVNTPSNVAIGVRLYLKRHGVQAAMDHFGIRRMALFAVAAEQTVQAQTLFACVDGLRRAETAT